MDEKKGKQIEWNMGNATVRDGIESCIARIL